jgi:hypothetical protein
MRAAEEGRYVKWEDHQTEVERLRGELDRLCPDYEAHHEPRLPEKEEEGE